MKVKVRTTQDLTVYNTGIEVEITWFPGDQLRGKVLEPALGAYQLIFGCALTDEMLLAFDDEIGNFLAGELANSLLKQGLLVEEINEITPKVLEALAPNPYYFIGTQNPAVLDNKVNKALLSRAADSLPGIYTEVEYPCACKDSTRKALPMRTIIMHLNDFEKWSREKIADWLDELHDAGKINIEF